MLCFIIHTVKQASTTKGYPNKEAGGGGGSFKLKLGFFEK